MLGHRMYRMLSSARNRKHKSNWFSGKGNLSAYVVEKSKGT